MNAQPLKTVFLDYDTVSNGDLDTSRLHAAAGTLVLYDSDASKIAERIHDADIALLNKLELSRELLLGAPRLKLVALAATGTNNVDLIAASMRRIAVCNVRAYCTASVVQHVWGLILGLTQHTQEFSRLSQDGSWTRAEAGAGRWCDWLGRTGARARARGRNFRHARDYRQPPRRGARARPDKPR